MPQHKTPQLGSSRLGAAAECSDQTDWGSAAHCVQRQWVCVLHSHVCVQEGKYILEKANILKVSTFAVHSRHMLRKLLVCCD